MPPARKREDRPTPYAFPPLALRGGSALPSISPCPMLVHMDPRATLAEVDRRLAHHLGEPCLERQDPLELLVRTILSQNTTDRNRDRAYASLRTRWGTWEDVLGAPTEELADAIKGAGLHRQRATRIKAVLRRIWDEQSSLQLDFLELLPALEAERWLLSLPGVGKKTAYIILLMGFGVPRFPVDTHIERVTKRLGMIGERSEPHTALAGAVPPGRELGLHLNLIQLGRQVCTARRPRCPGCPLADLCQYVGRKADPALRAALRRGVSPPVLVHRLGQVRTARPDWEELLAMLSDPSVLSVEAAGPVLPKEVA